MESIRGINIKNQTYYFFDDMINIKNFHSNLLKIDKSSYKDIDIYYICYITIKKFGDYENIHRVNLLYLIIYSAKGHFKSIQKLVIKRKRQEKISTTYPVQKRSITK